MQFLVLRKGSFPFLVVSLSGGHGSSNQCGLQTESHFVISLAGLRAALRLFKMALNGVIRSPISFYDTTPMGLSPPQMRRWFINLKPSF